jgi:hypothetical protein
MYLSCLGTFVKNCIDHIGQRYVDRVATGLRHAVDHELTGRGRAVAVVPAPMMQPIPSAVMLNGPSVLPSVCSPASLMMAATDFRVIQPWSVMETFPSIVAGMAANQDESLGLRYVDECRHPTRRQLPFLVCVPPDETKTGLPKRPGEQTFSVLVGTSQTCHERKRSPPSDPPTIVPMTALVSSFLS